MTRKRCKSPWTSTLEWFYWYRCISSCSLSVCQHTGSGTTASVHSSTVEWSRVEYSSLTRDWVNSLHLPGVWKENFAMCRSWTTGSRAESQQWADNNDSYILYKFDEWWFRCRTKVLVDCFFQKLMWRLSKQIGRRESSKTHMLVIYFLQLEKH